MYYVALMPHPPTTNCDSTERPCHKDNAMLLCCNKTLYRSYLRFSIVYNLASNHVRFYSSPYSSEVLVTVMLQYIMHVSAYAFDLASMYMWQSCLKLTCSISRVRVCVCPGTVVFYATRQWHVTILLLPDSI